MPPASKNRMMQSQGLILFFFLFTVLPNTFGSRFTPLEIDNHPCTAEKLKVCTDWFFVASYVMTNKNKLTERDVDNDIPH